MNTALLSLDQIIEPDFAERPPSRVSDDLLKKSIEQGGIQQPLVVLPYGERFLLVKGVRRLRAARALGIGKVPVIIDDCPPDMTPYDYARKIRFHLVEHRQDLVPSQKAELIEELKKRFNFTNAQVAAYLGIATDSVTNWMAVKKYVPPVVKAMDAGLLTMQAARVFDGMTEEGQGALWKAHGRDLMSGGGADAHKRLRAQYPPASFPSYYRNPELIARRLARKGGKRKGATRSNYSADDKRRLSESLEIREIELREGEAEMKSIKAEIAAAMAPIACILRSDKLVAKLSPAMREEFERFAEVYI